MVELHVAEAKFHINKMQARGVVRAWFRMIHSMLPADYLITDLNEEVERAVANYAHSVAVKEEKNAVVCIETHIYYEGDLKQRAEHFVTDINTGNKMRFMEDF